MSPLDLRRQLHLRHAQSIAASGLGAGLALVVGASAILSTAGLVAPSAAAAIILVALLTAVGLALGRHREEGDLRRDLADVVWRRLPYHPRRADLRAALGRSVDEFTAVYWRQGRSPALREAEEEHHLISLLMEMLSNGARIAGWLESLDDAPVDIRRMPQVQGKEPLGQMSLQRYRHAIQGLESVRQAIRDEQESLDAEFLAVVAQIESLCLATRQIEIGQARLDSLIREQVSNSLEFLDNVRAHARSIDRVVAQAMLEGGGRLDAAEGGAR